jgi:hypothetical protein
MFATLATTSRSKPHTEGIPTHMPTQTNGSKAASSKAKAKTSTTAEKKQTRSVAETAVDLPVGAVLSVTDRVSDLVEPFTGRSAAEKQLRS